MRTLPLTPALLAAVILGASGCSDQPDTGKASPPAAVAKPAPKVTRIEAGPDAPKQAQTAMIKAKPGEVIEFGAGKFEFPATLSLDVSGVTIRGQGPDKTDPQLQEPGPGDRRRGLAAHRKTGVTLQDLAVEDAKGDAIKVQGHQGAHHPQGPHRVDRRAEGDQRRLRALPGPLHGTC